MTLRRAVPVLLLGLVLIVSLVLSMKPAPSSSAPGVVARPAAAGTVAAAETAPKVVYFSLGSAVVKPKRIFMAYNSSPYLKRLKWRHWGTEKAVATGIYMSDCASCYGPDRRAAVVTLSKLVTCKSVGLRTYKRASVTVDQPDEGFTDTTYQVPTGCVLAVPGAS